MKTQPKYPETDQTFEALNNLAADKRFVKFSSIYEEVKRVRLEKNLMAEPANIKTRVRRSLYFDKNSGVIRNTAQSKLISIAARYPYTVVPKTPIILRQDGVAKTETVDNNSFMLKEK